MVILDIKERPLQRIACLGSFIMAKSLKAYSFATIATIVSAFGLATYFLGANLDNMIDRDMKGRHVNCPGERNGRAKITDDQAREIKSAKGVMVKSLAKKYGISPTRISRIRNGKEWKHLK